MTDSVNSRLSSPSPTPPETEDNRNDEFCNNSLDALQTVEQLKLMDTMDKLRGYGISEFVSLPQIIVCGDQSAGKSSVLEAITQVPFPRKENLCTRFATQIVLRRAPASKVSVTIIPDNVNPTSKENRERLEAYSAVINNFSELPDVIEKAGDAMGIGSSGSSFSQHVLNIEITGPSQPHLTVVDLPGLIHAGSNAQGEADVKIVSSLVGSYMNNERTIILAVVTAMNDFQNQIVLSRAKQVDPDGRRTLGIITKPDTIPVGSEKEDAFIALARNEEIFFGLGWHVLRNRNFEERNQTFQERNQTEELFFATGAWKRLDRNCAGITKLRERLSQLLYGHIKAELPKVFVDIKNGYDDCTEKLEKLGRPRTTVQEQRSFLAELSMKFVHLCKAAVEGSYEDPFFGDGVPLPEEDHPKRLRGVVQNLAIERSMILMEAGHTYNIREEGTKSPVYGKNRPESVGNILPTQVTQAWAVEWVKPLIQQSRGRELPGSYNPLLIGNLFWEQSKKWGTFTTDHLEHAHGVCADFVSLLVPHLTHKEVADSLFHHWLNSALAERLASAKEELAKILKDRRNHPITYNHYYTDNIQKSRAAEMEKQLTKAWNTTRGTGISEDGSSQDRSTEDETSEDSENIPMSLDNLCENFVKLNVTVDMDEYAAKEVLRAMEAFYKVACKTFVDNFNVLVVERHLLADLWDIFSPLTVIGMPDELITNIAGESPENLSMRSLLEAKKEMLGRGLDACQHVMLGSKLMSVAPSSKVEGVSP